MCAKPKTRRELQAALRLKDDDHFRVAYVLPALHGGFIEMTIPNKPTSSKQRYRLTAKGRATLGSRRGRHLLRLPKRLQTVLLGVTTPEQIRLLSERKLRPIMACSDHRIQQRLVQELVATVTEW
ncbi:MAG: hypothetical protein FJ225_09175 [Lentisphaerae bacterium]|nr:hypothetical protein [Lentisphaerota bacterium]